MTEPTNDNANSFSSTVLNGAPKATTNAVDLAQQQQQLQQQQQVAPLVCIILDSLTGQMEPVPVVDLIYEKKDEPFVIVKMLYSTYSKLLNMLQREAMDEMGDMQANSSMQDDSDLQHPSMSPSPQPDEEDLIIPRPAATKKHKANLDGEDDHIKGSWTEEEDRKLVELVKKHGPRRWSYIAEHLKGRIGKQCRERYLNHLSPEINKKAWTIHEDNLIIEMHSRMGNQWAKIARSLHGRTANAVKNHWNSTLIRKMEKSARKSRHSDSPQPMDDSMHSSMNDGSYYQTTTVDTPTPVYTATIGTAPNSPTKTSVKFNYADLLSSPQMHLVGTNMNQQTKRGREPDMPGMESTPERPAKRARLDMDSAQQQQQQQHSQQPTSPKTPGGSLRLETEEKMYNPFTTYDTNTGNLSPNSQYKMSSVASRRDQFNKNLTLDIAGTSEHHHHHVVPAPSAEGYVEFSLPDTPQTFAGAPECGIAIGDQQQIIVPTPSSTAANSLVSRELFGWSPRLLPTPKNDVNNSSTQE